MVNKQLYQLIEYARRTPHFSQLQKEDQITLLRAGWNELLIATVAFRSVEVKIFFFSFEMFHVMKPIFLMFIFFQILCTNSF